MVCCMHTCKILISLLLPADSHSEPVREIILLATDTEMAIS